MMRFAIFTSMIAMLVAVPVYATGQSESGGTTAMVSPDVVIRQAASEVMKTLQAQRTSLKDDPKKLYALVNKILLPHFDFEYTSRLVLGRYWRTASKQERDKFEKVFYEFLVHSYANGLLQYSSDKYKLVVQPWRGSSGDKRAMIRSQVNRVDGPPVHVDYAMHRTQDGWKAFDVTIEGISYVTNYRNQFSAEIQNTSLEALIARLEKEDAAPSGGKNNSSGTKQGT